MEAVENTLLTVLPGSDGYLMSGRGKYTNEDEPEEHGGAEDNELTEVEVHFRERNPNPPTAYRVLCCMQHAAQLLAWSVEGGSPHSTERAECMYSVLRR